MRSQTDNQPGGTVPSISHVSHWRARLLENLLKMGLGFGLLALAGAALNLLRPEIARPDLFLVYLVAYGVLWLLVLRPQLGFLLRSRVLLGVLYLLGTVGLMQTGLGGDGRIFLFAFTLIAAVLLGRAHGLVALGLSLVSMLVIGGVVALHLVPLAIDLQAGSLHLSTWLSGAMVFLLLSIAMVAITTYLLHNLDRSLESATHERRFVEAILDTSSALVLVLNTQGRVMRCNQAWINLTCFPADESPADESPAERVQGIHVWQVGTIPGDQQQVETIMQRLQLGVQSYTFEQVYQVRGEECAIAWTVTGLRDAAGQLAYSIWTGTDFTQHKQEEARSKRRFEQLQALHWIDQAIIAGYETGDVLISILAHVQAQLGVDAAAILLLDRSENSLEYAVGRGFPACVFPQPRWKLNTCYVGQVVQERRSVRVERLPQQSWHEVVAMDESCQQHALLSDDYHTYAALPLLSHEQVWGVLEVYHGTTFSPTEEWSSLLSTLATRAALAIENSSLMHDLQWSYAELATAYAELQRSNAELAQAYDETLAGWSRAMDLRDYETQWHSLRVTEMSIRLAKALGMPDSEIVQVRRGALLHDIGKMAIPDRVLLKPDQLTNEERRIMQRHPIYAYMMLSPIAYLRPALDIPRYHHEWWDGTGYPYGLRGEDIPLAARLFAVVDVWDAVTVSRPYRAAWSKEEARAHIRAEAGTHLDPRIVEVFLTMEW